MRTLQQIIDELATIPAGCLICRTDRLNPRYFYHYSDHGDRHQPQVPEYLIEQAISVDDHLSNLMQELSIYLENLSPDEANLLMRDIVARRYQSLARIIADHKPFPEKHTIYTLHGDYVASKSQALISMILERLKIKFHYKKPLMIHKNRPIFPTFTLYINGTPYYYEHHGQFHDTTHLANWQKRLQEYHSIGIYEGDQLLITAESDTGLDLLDIQKTIQDFVRSKM